METPDPDKFPGLLLVYTGDGKGKTTAALGLAFRALGRGFPVAVMQFIKGKWKTGERLFAATLPNLTFQVMGRGFTWESEDLRLDARSAQVAWDEAQAWICSGAYRIVILDEVTYAIEHGFLPLQEVIEVLRCRPPHVHVLITGRRASAELIELADLVTEMKVVKHPFTRGLRAQIGVDF